jgi:hypothetical protein
MKSRERTKGFAKESFKAMMILVVGLLNCWGS